MIMITLVAVPTESSKELGKRFLDLPPLPDYISLAGNYITSVVDEGLKGISIYEFDDSKYDDIPAIGSNAISIDLFTKGTIQKEDVPVTSEKIIDLAHYQPLAAF